MRDTLKRLEALVEHPEVTPGTNRIVPIDRYMRSPRNDADGPAGKLSRKISKKSGVYARRAKKKAGMRARKPKSTERERENNAAKKRDMERREAANKDRKGKRKKNLIRRAVDAIKNKVGDRKLRRLAAKLDELIGDESLECTDIGEAKVVVYQAIAAGYQGHEFVPADVAADRAFGYVRDRKLIEVALQALTDAGTLARGRDGEYWLAERMATNGDSGGHTTDTNFPVGTRPFRVGRKKAKGIKKTIVPRAIETGNDPGPNRDFKVE